MVKVTALICDNIISIPVINTVKMNDHASSDREKYKTLVQILASS